MKYYLAIDLGASSGRHIVGYQENGQIVLKEIYRFDNGVKDSPDGLVWDLDKLFLDILEGIKIALTKYHHIESLAIDTWAVDYVLLENNQPIKPYYAYRNNRTESTVNLVHSLIPFDVLYNKTGIQFNKFNSIYQLYWDKIHGRIHDNTEYLMVPEFLTYLLTGKKIHEYTNATSTGMVNLKTRKFDEEIISKLSLNTRMFGSLVEPGTLVGDLSLDIQQKVGGNIPVKMCASHDTASAFEAVDCDQNSIIISSGTWSLVGVKIKDGNNSKNSQSNNFTNEGGVGYIRYLKNIIGMWLYNSFIKEVGLSREESMKLMHQSSFEKLFDVQSETLVAPQSMKKAILALLNNDMSLSDGDILRSIFSSLAYSYHQTIQEVERNLNRTFNKIYIVGGGANNQFLNQETARFSKKEIIALPIEATALGNIKVQMKQR